MSICMLAHPYNPKRVIFPAYIQPKLDGIRAIWLHKEKRFISRNNKPLVLPLKLSASVITSPFDLDGELVISGKSFNEISGVVRHQDMGIEEKDSLRYIIFDVIVNNMIYSGRKELVYKSRGGNYIDIISTQIVNSEVDIQRNHQDNLDEGYEGSIIRNNTLYEFKRSYNLLKIKPTKEIICKIIGLIEGTGKYEGMLGALTVETPDKKIFNVGSGFNDEEREYIWNIPSYNNIYVKVKYQDLSEYGIPRFPIFKGFKE